MRFGCGLMESHPLNLIVCAIFEYHIIGKRIYIKFMLMAKSKIRLGKSGQSSNDESVLI